MQILKATDIYKVYGSKNKKQYTALKNISLEINKGDFIGIMGASGSGKTTLLNILGGIDKLTTGMILLDNKDISKLNKNQLSEHRRKNIGFIFQDYNLLDSMTLKENIILPLVLSGTKAYKIEEEVNKVASDLKLNNLLDKYPYEVSGGEQQRAAICRAIITNPQIVLADEPTGNLDSNTSKQVLKILTHINKTYGTTILLVTHDAFAASYCKKILFIRDGEIYNELYAGYDKKEFYESIINVIRNIGGAE